MTELGWSVAVASGAYLVGSIPFGVLVSKLLGTPDPRTVGSRNIGFTNVLRVSGKTAGFLTLAGDMGKGWVVGWFAKVLFSNEQVILLAAWSVIFGHLFSVFLRFQGGKGVATAFGALVGVAPMIGFGLLGIWGLTAGLFRYSSGAAIAAFLLFPVLVVGTGGSRLFLLFSLTISLMILLKHKENMKRLINGTEGKI